MLHEFLVASNFAAYGTICARHIRLFCLSCNFQILRTEKAHGDKVCQKLIHHESDSDNITFHIFRFVLKISLTIIAIDFDNNDNTVERQTCRRAKDA